MASSTRKAMATVIFSDAVQQLVDQANHLRSEIQKKINDDFRSCLDEDLHIGIFSLHKARIVNTAHVIKELDTLCGKPIDALADVCRFTVRLQSLIDKAKPSSVFSLRKKVALWLQQDCNLKLNPIAVRQNELTLKEDDIHNRKVEVLYHQLGREIELATVTPAVSVRAIRHEMAITAAILPLEGVRGNDIPENPATMYSVTAYSKELIRRMDGLKTQISQTKNTDNWTPDQERNELKKRLKRLLTLEAKDLAKMRIHADISRDIHTKRIQDLSPEKKVMHFLVKALLEELADYLKYCEKLFLWEKRCKLQARRDRDRSRGYSYSPSMEFGLDLLSTMYNEEKLLKNLSYPRRVLDESASPTGTPVLPVKQQINAEDLELVNIPEFAHYLKTDGKKTKLAAALFHQQAQKTKKTLIVDEEDKYFISDIMGVAEQAAKLKSYAGQILGDDLFDEVEICLNLAIDDHVFIPTIHDDTNLADLKKEFITELVNEWKDRVRRIVHGFCNLENPRSVLSCMKDYIVALEKDPSFQPKWVNEEEKQQYQPYFDLVCFVKQEIKRADHQSLLIQYPQLMQMLNNLKQAVQPIVEIVKNKMAKQNISALETAAFLLLGVGFGVLVLTGLIATNVIVPTSMTFLAVASVVAVVLGGAIGFAIKKIKNYFHHVQDENIVSQQLDHIKQIETASASEKNTVKLQKISPTTVNAKLHAAFNAHPASMQPALRTAPLPPPSPVTAKKAPAIKAVKPLTNNEDAALSGVPLRRTRSFGS
jgi:hypothetical protein